jgi:hypothetical protein
VQVEKFLLHLKYKYRGSASERHEAIPAEFSCLSSILEGKKQSQDVTYIPIPFSNI